MAFYLRPSPYYNFSMTNTQPLKPHLLIVDDESSLVELCQMILEEAGFQVRGAYSGQQALRMIREQLPDIILLDVMMPGMTGIEVCQEIRSQYNGVPRIFMYTADDREETRRKSLDAGANAVIYKDISILDLPRKLTAYMSQ
ncbi:MAG: hypothetical protein Kow0080_17270 [Candidatus Promineifilaceae bacterium]